MYLSIDKNMYILFKKVCRKKMKKIMVDLI